MYPVSIKAVLFVPSGEVVLLLNEREQWELPGGRIDVGETPTQCVEREIREELDLRVEIDPVPLDTWLFEVLPGRHVFIATYRATLAGPYAPSLSHEHTRLGLFRPEALPSNLPAGYRTSIEAAQKLQR